MMIWYEKWLRNFMIIIHQLLIVVYMPALHYIYITHIKFTYTVTRLTSTLIKSVRCYKNDYHEKNDKLQHMYHHQHNYYMYTMY